MKSLIRIAAIGALLLGGYLIVRMLGSAESPSAPTASAPEAETPKAAARGPAGSADLRRPTPGAAATPTPQAPVARHEEHGHEEKIGNRELAASLNASPLSEAPHRVLRAWGGRPEQMVGPVGLRIVVEPSMPTSELERLVRDLRSQYSEAVLFSTHVYDDEEAATYDKHSDGGAFAERHLVARVVRDPSLDEDTILIRGNAIEP